MPFLVTDSAGALPAETLPALKLTERCGQPARGHIYAYLRCYVRGGAFHYDVTVFDGAAPSTQRAGLALSADDGAERYLWAEFGAKGGESLAVCRAGGEGPDRPEQTLALPAVRRTAGGDEQGLYWGVQGVIPADAFLAAFGRAPRAGMILPGNVFLYDTREAAFLSAFPAAGRVPTAQGFEPFVIVPY